MDENSSPCPIVAAGVLFFDPSGRILLGQECCTNPGFNEAGRWSSFEGRRKSGETILETCGRETCEESLGLFEQSYIQSRITNQQYERRIVCTIRTGGRRRFRRLYYLMGLSQDECDNVVDKFEQRRRAMLAFQEALMHYKACTHRMPDFPVKGSITKKGEIVRSAKLEGNRLFYWTSKTKDDEPFEVRLDCKSINPARAETAMKVVRSKLNNQSWIISSGAYNPYTMHLNTDFLEKQQLQFFSPTVFLADNQRSPLLRSFFRPVLMNVLSLFALPPDDPGGSS